MKVSVNESEVRRIDIGAPFKRTVRLLASTEKGMDLPGVAGPALGVLHTKRLTVGITDIPPGGGLAPHIHDDTEEIIYALSGTAEYVVGNERIVMKPGTVLHIPPGTRHEATNRSDTALKQIWCTC